MSHYVGDHAAPTVDSSGGGGIGHVLKIRFSYSRLLPKPAVFRLSPPPSSGRADLVTDSVERPPPDRGDSRCRVCLSGHHPSSCHRADTDRAFCHATSSPSLSPSSPQRGRCGRGPVASQRLRDRDHVRAGDSCTTAHAPTPLPCPCNFLTALCGKKKSQHIQI